MVTVTMERLSGLVRSTQHYLLAESRYIRLLEIAVVVLLALALADLAAGWINARYQASGTGSLTQLRDRDGGAGVVPTGTGLAGARPVPVAVRQLFGMPRQTDIVAGEDRIAGDKLKETQLNLRLKGVLMNRDDGTRLALIARPGQAEEIFREGDRIENAEIYRIEPGRVILRRNGINEVLNMDIQKLATAMIAPTTGGRAGFGRNGVKAVSERERVVSQGTLRRQLNNLPRLLQQARAVPYMENGRAMGFRMVSIQSGSVFEDLGLQREDIIRSVNGKQLRTSEDALSAYRDLRTTKSFQVELLRGGSPVTLNLSVQ